MNNPSARYIPVLVVAILCAAAAIIKNTKRSRTEYDERQRLARGRACTLAFWTLMVYNCACGVFDIYFGLVWAPPSVQSLTGALAAVVVFAVTCIFSDAYIALKRRMSAAVLTLSALLVLFLIILLTSLSRGAGFVTDGALNVNFLFLVAIASLAAVLAALAIKSAKTTKACESE